MEFRHVAGFLAVAEELHFGRAAERLHMAQPPLSQQIRALERELGVVLFERNTRSVRLTPAGEALLPYARRVLDDVEAARFAARAGGRGEVGRVSIAFTGPSSREEIPALTRAVRAAHPGIELRLESGYYAGATVAAVADRSIDLGFVRMPIRRAGVQTRVYKYERLVAVLPIDHPLAGEPDIDVAELAEDAFVSLPGARGSTVREHIVAAAMQAGFAPRIVQEAGDTYTLLDLVAAGVGVTLTVSSVRHIRSPGMVYKELRGERPPIEAALAWREDNESPALRAVLRVAEEVFPGPSEPKAAGAD